MRRLYQLLLVAMALIAVSSSLRASLYDYAFTYGSGTRYELTSPTTLWEGYTYGGYTYGGTSTIDIGFYFNFDGTYYDQVTVSAHGVIGLGDYVNSSGYNYMANEWYPIIAPYWDDHRTSGTRGGQITPLISYQTIGSEPNRILVIDYDEIELVAWGAYGASGSQNLGTYQARLYEGTGKIEFWYGSMETCSSWGWCVYTSATIGIANGQGEYISVIPDGAYAYEQRSWPYDYIDLNYNSIDEDMLYTFKPCQITTSVDRSVAGSTDDILLGGARVKKWDAQSFYPLAIENYFGSCYNDRYWRVEITGPNASEYMVTNPEGWISYGGTVYPEIVFMPTAGGVRYATITITDDHYYTRSIELAGVGIARIDYIPDLNTFDGGGTPGMATGDTLMNGILVPRPQFRDFHPFRLFNSVYNEAAPPASITIRIDSLDDISQQFVLQTSATWQLNGGESYTPIIRFLTYNVGAQEARITIQADGDERWFLMRPISAAPAVEFWAGNMKVDASNPLFQWTTTCAGEAATSVPIEIRSTGTQPLTVSDLSFWLTDTVYGPGVPPYPLARDMYGRAMRSADYAFSDIPGVAPIPANAGVTLPFTLQPGQKRTIYATFVSQLPGKRFARAFFLTNAQNAYGIDTNATTTPVETMGLATIDLVGQGIGSSLAFSPDGLPLNPVVFPATRVGALNEVVTTIANAGNCDLRISREDFRIFSGDVNEFKIVSAFAGSISDRNGNWVIPPGGVDSIRLSFKPTRSGTRIARLRIHTNDSTVYLPGLTERGSYYLDLHGYGRSGLDGHDLVLDPVVIGSSSVGVAEFESTVNAPVEIQSIVFMGGDADQFFEDASAPWPATPHSVLPGEKLRLGIRMTPVGDPGVRRTTLFVVSTTGDTAVVNIRGEAGTRALTVSPSSLFDNVTLGVGQATRQTVMISNNGTLPIRLTSVAITGTDAANYRMGRLPRVDLAAGATEYLEITFAPTGTGQSSAQLEVIADGASYTVALGGESMMAKEEDPDVDVPTTPAGVTGEISSVTALSVHPNPAVTEVVLSYRLRSAATVTVDVFNAAGSLVDRVAVGARPAGAQEARIDVSRLPSGTYRFSVRSGDAAARGSFTVAR